MLQKMTWLQNPKGESTVVSTSKNVHIERVYFFLLGEKKEGKKIKALLKDCLKMFGRKVDGRDVVNFILSGFSVCFSGLSGGGTVANLKHTDLFLMQLFLPGTSSCWKMSPYTNIPLVSTFQS